jgi:hypothetical protein
VAAPKDVRGALELFGLVIAPTTVITALAFYFGWTLTNARVSYFGIDVSALDFSTQDYLLRSADALFVPLGAVLALALLAVWLHALVTRALEDGSRRPQLRRAAGVAIVAGCLLFALGVTAVFTPLPFSPHYLLAPASPGVGIGLLAYGVYLTSRLDHARRCAGAGAPWTRPLSVTLVWLLIVLSGFWTASEYADALGRGRAQALARALDGRPRVAVYAPRRLHITGDGVTEQRLHGGDAAYRYRYAGLRLLVHSAGKYFLVGSGWSHARGVAFVLADSPPYRFEFGGGR